MRDNRKSGFSIVGAVLGVALCLAAAGPARAQIIERDMHRGIMEDPMALDPQYSVRPVERAILADLFSGLVVEDSAGVLQPEMAASWQVENKGRRWVFTLRQGVKWSDGRPVVAEDFVYAFQRLLAPRTTAPFASMFYIIAAAESLHAGKERDPAALGVRAKDPQTLVFELVRPTPYFLSMLAHPSAVPLRRDLIEGDGDNWMRPGRMVSNGTYILGEWLPGRYIKLRKNWGFYDPAQAVIDNVYYDIVDEGEVALERFFAGELDILSDIPREWTAELMDKAPEAVRLFPTLTVDYLVFNTRRIPFDNVNVRKALALAIDSRELVTEVLARGEIPADGMLPKGMANQREAARPAPPDPRAARRPESPEQKREKAEEILKLTGYGVRDSLRVTLAYNNNPTHRKIVEAIAASWRKLGIQVDLYANHYAVHYGDLGIGDFEIARAGWIADFNDPMAVLELFRSKNDPFNYGNFSDDRFDRQLAQADAQADPRERSIGLRRAHERALSLYPVIPLYHHSSRHLVAPRVVGWEDNVRDIHPSRWLNLEE